jgi:hypothetical protein
MLLSSQLFFHESRLCHVFGAHLLVPPPFLAFALHPSLPPLRTLSPSLPSYHYPLGHGSSLLPPATRPRGFSVLHNSVANARPSLPPGHGAPFQPRARLRDVHGLPSLVGRVPSSPASPCPSRRRAACLDPSCHRVDLHFFALVFPRQGKDRGDASNRIDAPSFRVAAARRGATVGREPGKSGSLTYGRITTTAAVAARSVENFNGVEDAVKLSVNVF